MLFLFHLDLSLHAGTGKKIWNFEYCNWTRAKLTNSPACYGNGIVSVGFQFKVPTLKDRRVLLTWNKLGSPFLSRLFSIFLSLTFFSCTPVLFLLTFLSPKHIFCMHGLTLIIMCVAFYSTHCEALIPELHTIIWRERELHSDAIMKEPL